MTSVRILDSNNYIKVKLHALLTLDGDEWLSTTSVLFRGKVGEPWSYSGHCNEKKTFLAYVWNHKGHAV